jgi:hypothetical protein
MPRKSSQGQNIYIYAPTNIRKRSRSRSISSVFAPTNSKSNSVSNESKYAPSTIISRSTINRRYNDYSPSISQNLTEDYSPLNYTLQSYRRKYAPSFNYEYILRYAPSNDDQLYYEPKLVSRFKPQVVLVSNHDTLDSYYNYIIQLLKVLR